MWMNSIKLWMQCVKRDTLRIHTTCSETVVRAVMQPRERERERESDYCNNETFMFKGRYHLHRRFRSKVMAQKPALLPLPTKRTSKTDQTSAWLLVLLLSRTIYMYACLLDRVIICIIIGSIDRDATILLDTLFEANRIQISDSFI